MVPPTPAGEVSCRVRAIGARPPQAASPQDAHSASDRVPRPRPEVVSRAGSGGRGWADRRLAPGHRWPGHAGTVGRARDLVATNGTDSGVSSACPRQAAPRASGVYRLGHPPWRTATGRTRRASCRNPAGNGDVPDTVPARAAGAVASVKGRRMGKGRTIVFPALRLVVWAVIAAALGVLGFRGSSPEGTTARPGAPTVDAATPTAPGRAAGPRRPPPCPPGRPGSPGARWETP